MRKTFVIMTGAPGSGKSTLAAQYKRDWIEEGLTVELISRDNIRFDLLGKDDDYFRYEKEVIKKYHKKLRECIVDPFVDVIIADSTNINKRARRKLIELAKEADPDIYILSITMMANVEDCIRQNELREGRAKCPEEVIRKAMRAMEIPSRDEGFDDIWIKRQEVII